MIYIAIAGSSSHLPIEFFGVYNTKEEAICALKDNFVDGGGDLEDYDFSTVFEYDTTALFAASYEDPYYERIVHDVVVGFEESRRGRILGTTGRVIRLLSR